MSSRLVSKYIYGYTVIGYFIFYIESVALDLEHIRMYTVKTCFPRCSQATKVGTSDMFGGQADIWAS